MRFVEFKVIKEAQEATYVAIGDSHAAQVAVMGGRSWLNLAVGGASSKGTHPKIQEMLGNISKIPKGSVVLVSLGANDTANAMTAGKPSRTPSSIAADVAAVIGRVNAQGPSKVVFLLFPNGPGRGSKDAKFYGGEFQDQVRAAIRSAVGVPIIDINGKPLYDGIHAGNSTYREVASEVMRMAKPASVAAPTTAAGTSTTSGISPKPAAEGNQFGDIQVPTTRREPAIADIQKFLTALAKSQGKPNPLPRHGIDGIRGRETTMAVMLFQRDNGLEVDGDPGPETVGKINAIIKSKPDIFKGITKSTDADVKPARGSFEKRKIDKSAIQDPDFNKKLQKIADKLGVAKSDLLAIMRLESGVDPSRQNDQSKAIGLIQFMPKTARELGTSTEELRNMTAVQQLDYVYEYFVMRGVRPGMNLGDLYLAVFWPAGVGKPDDYVIARKGNIVYTQNSGLDVNKDGIITAGDTRRAVQRYA